MCGICLRSIIAVLFAGALSAAGEPISVSGRYPSLAEFNTQGECGTGALAEWAGKLWVVTYAPHKPQGSDDKLYEIDSALHRVARPESVGGTPADRMIHRESNQLIIGPYLIDDKGNVRVVSPKEMPGRLTAAARSLDDPANKVYVYDMEGMLYELDVHTLAAKLLYKKPIPGWHGKGAYSGQGRLVLANNGQVAVFKRKDNFEIGAEPANAEEAGVLAEWDGKNKWDIVLRREFTDVTSAGGICGAPDDKAPLWTIGWDKRSVMLLCLDAGAWHTYRLPIADYSYVAKNGYYTEWPRIREVTDGKFLMNMHGQWFDFPRTFCAANTGGLRPIGDYLKITGDFCAFNNRIVFGCDDASKMQNPLDGRSQSNLWFTRWEDLSRHGRPAGFGGVWLNDHVNAGEPSTPYLFNGYVQRVLHVANGSDHAITITAETDADGKGEWKTCAQITVPPQGYNWHVFPEDQPGEWIRLTSDRDCPSATAYFHYGPGGGEVADRDLFASLAGAGAGGDTAPGTLQPLDNDPGTLLFNAHFAGGSSKLEIDSEMNFRRFDGIAPREAKDEKSFTPGLDCTLSSDAASAILTDGRVRYRLPVSNADCDKPVAGVAPRTIREVVTERYIVNEGGSMFVLPRPEAGGALRIKPICTHNKLISDFCSWRGITVLSGAIVGPKKDGHYFSAGENQPGLWFGDIDDLWKLGKPAGRGGPWLNSRVVAHQPSDPYLMAGYDQKTLDLSVDGNKPIQIDVEVDVAADNSWQTFKTFTVSPGTAVHFQFPQGYSAHWIRFRCSADCTATAQLQYN